VAITTQPMCGFLATLLTARDSGNHTEKRDSEADIGTHQARLCAPMQFAPVYRAPTRLSVVRHLATITIVAICAIWGTAHVSGTTLIMRQAEAGAVHSGRTGNLIRVASPAIRAKAEAQRHFFDYDGDQKDDLIMFDGLTGNWSVLPSLTDPSSALTIQFGATGDLPSPGDYDGDGALDLAVYRTAEGTWYVKYADPARSTESIPFVGTRGSRNSTAIPVAADYNGDGVTDLALYDPVTGRWSFNFSGAPRRSPCVPCGFGESVVFGVSGDMPVPGDYDGDGITDIAVYRPSTGTWYVLQSTSKRTRTVTMQWGLAEDLPVPGDYDGDGIMDFAVWRPSTGVWYIRLSSTGFVDTITYQLGTGSSYRGGDVPVPADYDGDGKTDPAVLRKSPFYATPSWYVLESTTGYSSSTVVEFGYYANVPVAYATAYGEFPSFPEIVQNHRGTPVGPRLPELTRAADFDGDYTSDLAMYRPSTGAVWSLGSSETTITPPRSATIVTLPQSVSTDLVIPGDFDGDGRSDLATYRPSTGMWSIARSSFGHRMNLQWGLPGDIPLSADFDGDGKSDVTVYRPVTGEWYLLLSSTNSTQFAVYQWGLPGDVPVPGDYDGDGLADLAVWRPATGVWYIRYSTTGYATSNEIQWGLPGDITVPGDYDADGKADLAVWRPSNGVWYILQSHTSYTTFVAYQWGLPGDIPVPGDYDGDSFTEIAVWRPSNLTWYFAPTRLHFAIAFPWGEAGDVPIAGRQ
jgi:VCBS repeat protein